MSFIPQKPLFQMGFSRHEILFALVAGAVSEHEVVSEIGRIPGPRDEVIHLGRGDRAMAVQTLSVLQIQQGRDHALQSCAIAAEQELLEIGGPAEQVGIGREGLHEPQPFRFCHADDKTVETSQVGADARLEPDASVMNLMAVQELEIAAAQSLQAPEWIVLDVPRHRTDCG